MKNKYKSVIILTLIAFICSLIIYLMNKFIGGTI